jgi:hypothetical protein
VNRRGVVAGGLALAVGLLSSAAVATLPPPSPQELAAQEAKKVAEQYRREHPSAGASNGGGRVADTNMPYPTRQLPPAGPHGGDKQSAEAHSAPAK